jgi:hypothetical protein
MSTTASPAASSIPAVAASWWPKFRERFTSTTFGHRFISRRAASAVPSVLPSLTSTISYVGRCGNASATETIRCSSGETFSCSLYSGTTMLRVGPLREEEAVTARAVREQAEPDLESRNGAAVQRVASFSFAIIVLASAVGCTERQAQQPRPALAERASVPPHHFATETVRTPTPSATVSATARPTPSATPNPRPTVTIPRRAPDAPPEIVAVAMNSTTISSGQTLWGKVLTSSNVASVEVRVATYGIGLKKVGVGRFELTYRLGYIPVFVRGTYAMRIIARNTRGDAVDRTLPLTIR